MTLGRMTVVTLATMMTAEVVAAVATMIIVVADETMTAPENMTEETVNVIAVVMAEKGMMTGGTRLFIGC